MTTAETAKLKPERLMKLYQITRAESMVQLAILNLWYFENNYTNDALTTDDRIKMTEEFTLEYAVPSKIKVDKPFLRHPMTWRKQMQRTVTIAEILADFILRIDQVEERKEEYPIHGAEKVLEDSRKSIGRDMSIYSQSEADRDDTLSMMHLVKYGFTNGASRPSYSMNESEVIENMTVVGEYSKDYEPPTVEEFTKILHRVKANPEKWARKFEEKGYNYAESLRRIKRIDLERVRECLECCEPFYTHDLRRKVCDMQHGIVGSKNKGWRRSEQSHCEIQNAHKRSEKQRENA